MYGYLVNDVLFNIEDSDISLNYGDNYNENYIINKTLKEYLINIKMEINLIINKWDVVKKFTNKYEYINTPINIENTNIKATVCSYKPISRSYFKMIEILKIYDFKFPKDIASFHLAEGPGGFIEALTNVRKNINDVYYGMTLMTKNKDIPNWNKIDNFLSNNKNIQLIYGPKKDGNLYFRHNLDYIKSNFKNKMDFITADGGFDYSVDFNKQEENSINLIFCEVIYALTLQKQGGSFILKVFDIFHSNTIEILYILSYFYDRVYIYKPLTSREANSEKYLICINFDLKSNYENIMTKLTDGFINLDVQKVNKILNHDLNCYFLNKVQEINAIYGQQQIEKILTTVNYIHDESSLKEKLNKIKKVNIEKCKKWCKDYNQPITEGFISSTVN
tara:strand:- start:1260 stop:2432 length:1173 start_codon:yes stop_codon:yes gene_type:complete